MRPPFGCSAVLRLAAVVGLCAISVLPADAAGPKVDPKLVVSPALEPVDVTKLPDGVERLDIYLLMGQSNMRGRGLLTGDVARDPHVGMLHLTQDKWYVARDSLHHSGDPRTDEGCSREGVSCLSWPAPSASSQRAATIPTPWR